MGVSAVVVTYNRVSLLKECLNHILNQKYQVDYVFVINNNSTDGTKEYLDNLHNPKVVVKNLRKNLGGAGGFSIGTELAYENSRSDFFWLMDDDSMPTPDALLNLMKASKRVNNIGFMCSNVRWWKNNKPVNIPQVTSDWTKFLPGNVVKVKRATFVSFLVSRQAVKKLGLPIADMFIWGDDWEYTTRIINSGFNAYFVTNSIVLHKSSENNGHETIFNAAVPRLMYFKHIYRNSLYSDRKYYSWRKVLATLLTNLRIILAIPFKSKNHRTKRVMCVLVSTIKGLFFNPTVKFPKKN